MAPAPPSPLQAAQGLDLLARLLEAPNLQQAVHRLATGLAEAGGFSRVSVALLQGTPGELRLAGSSQARGEAQATALDERLLGAMSEAIDQAQALAWPPVTAQPAWPSTPGPGQPSGPSSPSGPFSLTGLSSPSNLSSPSGPAGPGAQRQPIVTPNRWSPPTVEQRLLQQLVGGAVASLPLGQQGKAVGAVCVERHRPGPQPGWQHDELQRLQALLALATPALLWMQAATLPWHRRAAQQARHALARWQRPAARHRRLAVLLGVLASAAALLMPVASHVGGQARIEGAQQRVLAAPSDGFVHTVHARPGDRVAAGAPLVDLQDADLRLDRQRWQSQLAQHENAYASAMGRGDRLTAATSMARFNEAQAQLALVDAQLARGRLVAPFDALVVQGDLNQSIGAPVRQGDALLTLASSGRHRVVIEVDEVDIAAIRPGQRGWLAVSAWPGDAVAITVQRISPLAKPVLGHNVFEVEAQFDEAPSGAAPAAMSAAASGSALATASASTLATSLTSPSAAATAPLLTPNPQAQLRPGLLGRADIHTGEAPLLWAWGRRALLRLRVAVWGLLG